MTTTEANTLNNLVTSAAFAARLLQRLNAPTLAALRAEIDPADLAQIDEAVARHNRFHSRYCECCV